MAADSKVPRWRAYYLAAALAVFASTYLGGRIAAAQSHFSTDAVLRYASLAGLSEDYRGPAYIVGKAVVINTGESISLSRLSAREEKHNIPANTVSAAHGKIDPAIRASAPTEVETVVLLEWAKLSLGDTAAGTKYRLRCQATVVDRGAQRIVARQTFLGGEPRFATLYGPSPEGEIVRWIKALPRRGAGSTRAELAQKGSGGTIPAPGTPGRVASDMRKYSDVKNKLSFSYPGAWRQMAPAEARQVMGANMSKYLTLVLYDPRDRDQNVNVQVLPTAAQDLSEAAFREFAREMDRRFPNDMPGFRKLSSRVGRLRDMASLEYVFEATRPDGVRLRQKQLRTGKPGREVAITFTAPAEAYDKADATCFRIIANTLALE